MPHFILSLLLAALVACPQAYAGSFYGASSGGGVTAAQADTDFAIATQGASFWWKRNSTSGTNKTFVYHRGFTFDRSGVTY